MKKTVIFTLLALCLTATTEPEPAQATACDPTSILPGMLQYVAHNYGVDGSHCSPFFGAWACYYADGRLAALVQYPTAAKVQQQYCSGVSDWFNCPLNGGQCVLVARVRCGGLVGINWRDQCARFAP